LFDSVPGLYLVLSPTSGFPIVAVSNGYLQATATRREDLLGRHLLAAFPDNPAEPQATGFLNLSIALERVMWSRTPNTLAVQKFYIRRPADPGGGFDERFWSVYSSPVLDPSDALQYIICSVQDVTASRKAAEPELLREEWASTVAHDLQQPVHALVLGADLLRRQVTDDKGRRTIERIRSSALRLSRMIQDLGAMAKLESRQLTLQPEPLALCALVRDLLRRHPDAADRLVLQAPPEGELQVLADAERVDQVLTNLVTNAIKYSEPATPICVAIKLHAPFAQH
jgi:signal transduction histidine kinase